MIHLGLPAKFELPETLFDHLAVANIRAATRDTFEGVGFLQIKYGPDGFKVHTHIIADKWAGLPNLKRDSERCKPVSEKEGGLRGLIRYLSKPLPNDPKLLALYREAAHHNRLYGRHRPHLSGHSTYRGA